MMRRRRRRRWSQIFVTRMITMNIDNLNHSHEKGRRRRRMRSSRGGV